MLKIHLPLIGTVFLSMVVLSCLSPAIAATIDLPQYGFTIEALDAPPSSMASTTALMTFLPVSHGFAPNINVNIQPYEGSLTNYVALSKDQFEKVNLVIISEKQNGETDWSIEYMGPMQGNNLHFYARAVCNDGKIYLVTATAKEIQWSSVSQILRKNVDTFKTR